MKRTAIVSALLVVGLGLAGCSSSGGPTYSGPEVLEPDTSVDGGAAEDAAGQDSSSRSEVTTGYITITAEEPIESAAEAIRIVEGVGGRVDSRQEYAPVDGDKGSASLTLRIPSEVLTATIDRLKKLGEVEEVSISSVDVTSQVQDIDARVRALSASVDRLTELLATATNTEALVQIEASLSQRQAELESMLTQQRSIGDQVSLATISLTLISVADAPVDPPVNFFTGLETGWNSFVAFVSATIVVVGVLLPWLAFFALIGAVIWLLLRRRRRQSPKP